MKSTTAILVLFFMCSINISKGIIPNEQGFVPVKGGNLFYEIIGEGEPLVIVHGGPGLDHTYFLPQMEVLAGKYRLIFYDQRACGKSSIKVDSSLISMDQFVEDLESLRKFFKLEKMSLFGHSFGGLIAMRYAIKYPENLKSLLLVNSTASTSAWRDSSFKLMDQRKDEETMQKSEALMKTQAFKNRDPDTMAYFFRLLFKKSFFNPTKVNELTFSFEPTYPETSKLMNYLFNDSSLTTYDLNPLLSKLNVPVLIIGSEADIISPLAVDELHQTIKSSTYVMLESCGHFPFIEQPEMFLKAIDKFFAKL